ncbi:hypothetical protein R3W88_025775 [Solanum pinnatisectum]|uniref:F-box associated beta-propeller type 1 domain-containing protein n=1 Tax=Solanum pinnatisectum TaxID=50273 RepID=A0AAV9M4M2_9SOLN|nr:hypothetical protein R3W88_025775 [Solanum pinnatisectum]
MSNNKFAFEDHDTSSIIPNDDILFCILIRLPVKFLLRYQSSPMMNNSQVLCSYDGLLLLVTCMAYKTFVLWNPSTKQQKTLECSYLDKSTCPCASGLCYDSATDDYKIILIYTSFYESALRVVYIGVEIIKNFVHLLITHLQSYILM